MCVVSRSALAVLVILIGGAWPLSGAIAQPDSEQRWKASPLALRGALQRYGWSLPFCVWPNKRRVSLISTARELERPLFCVTAAELLKKYSLSREFITTQIIEAAVAAYALDPTGSRDPESVMQKITGGGYVAACVPKGANKGVVTLGVMKPLDAKAAQVCESAFESKTHPRANLAFGALVGSSPQTPIVSISAPGQASYENYYQECKERQRTGAARQSLMEATNTTDKQKKADEAQKKATQAAEEAAKKQKEADQAKKEAEDAKKKEEDANKTAQDTYNDPNASNDDKRKAGQAAVNATNDRMAADANAAQKQKEADDAKKGADDAAKAASEAQKDADLQKAVGDATDKLGGHVLDGDVLDPLAAVFVVGEWAASVYGAYGGRLGFDCMEGECGYSSCEGEARAKAAEDEIRSYRVPKTTCNITATPLPDQDGCYDRFGGLFDVAQITLAEQLKMACKVMQKVSDRRCDRVMPPQIFRALFEDPCKSPYGMCAPDSSLRVSGGMGNPSTLLSPAHHGNDPGMWVTQGVPRHQ